MSNKTNASDDKIFTNMKLFDVFYIKVLFAAFIIFLLKTGSNFLLGNITSEVYLGNSSKLFSNEVLIKGIFNTILLIGLAIFFLKKKEIK